MASEPIDKTETTQFPRGLVIYVCPDCKRLNVGANDCPACEAEICRMRRGAKVAQYARANTEMKGEPRLD